MCIVSGIMSKGFSPQHDYVLKLQGRVSALAGPQKGLEFGFRVQVLCLWLCLAGSHQQEPGASGGSSVLLLTLRLGTEFIMVLSFMEGRQSCGEENRQMCS